MATVLAYKQVNYTYTVKPSPAHPRAQIAAQFVHNLYRRQVQSWNPYASPYTMSYVTLGGAARSGTARVGSYHPDDNDYECQNFYIARCGDGVQDNPAKSAVDGKNGISV